MKKAKRKHWAVKLREEFEQERAKLQAMLDRDRRALARALCTIADYKADERARKQDIVDRWNMYDAAAAEVTKGELELFQASPAYQRYRQKRAATLVLVRDDKKVS